MKPFITLILIFLAFIGNLEAQEVIALQNGSRHAFYALLDSALKYAQNKDTLYIPAGSFVANTIIKKELHIVGNGHNPDSTAATGITMINKISLDTGASNGSLTGVLVNGGFDAPSGSLVLRNYKVSRCNLGSVTLSGQSTDCTFSENIVRGGFNANASFCTFDNNILGGTSGGTSNNCTYKNNVFLANAWSPNYGGTYYYPVNATYSTYENNIFLSSASVCPVSSASNSVFRNNLFVYNWGGPDHSTFFGSGNIVNQAQTSIFVNQTGNSFNYTHNYHLKDSCPGKNKGTDGTDVGIYGGRYPWKEGSLPFNPHIQRNKVAGYTNANGNLPVTIRVAAQEQ